VAATLAAAAAYALLRPASEETLVPALAVAAAVAAALWALADLERFTVVAVLAAMAFPHAVLQPAGAQVAAADLLLLLALGAWLARAALGTAPPLQVAGNPVVGPALVFAGVTAASFAWTTSLPATTKAAVQIAEIVVVVMLVYASLPRSLDRIREGLLAYVTVTSVLAVVTAIAFASRAVGGSIGPQYFGQFHKNAIGSFLGVGLVLAYALALERGRSAGSRRLLAAAVALQAAGLTATISRGAILGSLLGLLAVAVLLRRARLRTAVLVGGAALAFLFTIQAYISEQVRAVGGTDTVELRLLSYEGALEKIRENPLLGTGAGTYWDEIPEVGGALADPNNLFLHTWAELGLAGLAALLVLLAAYGRLLFRARRLPEPAAVLAVATGGAAFSLIVHFQFDVTWTRGLATLCFALIGLMVATVRLARPAPAHDAPGDNLSPARVVRASAEPMGLRVVHVVTSENFAGTERHVLQLAKGLLGTECEPVIACPPGARRLRAEAAAAGVPVLPAAGARLLEILEGDPPHVIHAHDGRSAVLGWRLASSGPTRLVRTQHFIETASAGRRGWLRAASLAAHRALNADVDAFVAVSASVAEAAKTRGEADPRKVVVIPPGTELPTLDDVRSARAARRKQRAPMVAFVGRLEAEKSVSLLLCAAALVVERLPGCRFVIAGAGSLEDELRGLARSLGIEEAVSWLGHVDDVGPVLASAHVYAQPCDVDGFGLATTEAMAYELPVVGRAAGGTAEIVEDEISGLLVEEADPSAFADAIVRLASDRPLGARMGKKGRVRVAKLFAVERTVEDTLAVYRRVLGR
jgi:glycosyltransferase involved in cell wall biosynthesis/O-antigen ligase